MIFTRRTKAIKRPAQPEHRMQVALFQWAALAAGQDARLRLLFAVGNGGKRNVIVARKMKAEGVKAGVPDVCLPVPCGGYHGLWLELKIKPNKPSPEQVQWLAALAAQGFRCEVVYDDWDKAREIIESYLGTYRSQCRQWGPKVRHLTICKEENNGPIGQHLGGKPHL